MNKRTALRITTILAIVVLLLAQAAPAIATPPPGKGKPPAQAKWTFMVYIVGDNNLDEYVPLDIETELAPAGSNEDVSRRGPRRQGRHGRMDADAALLRHPGHGGHPRKRRGGLGRGQHGRPADADRLYRVDQGQLPRRPLCPVPVEPRVVVASGPFHARRHRRRHPGSARARSGAGPGRPHRRHHVRRLPDGDHREPGDGASLLAGHRRTPRNT